MNVTRLYLKALWTLLMLLPPLIGGVVVWAGLLGRANTSRFAGPTLAASREVRWLRCGFTWMVAAGITEAVGQVLPYLRAHMINRAIGIQSDVGAFRPQIVAMSSVYWVSQVAGAVAVVLIVMGLCGLIRQHGRWAQGGTEG